MKVSGFEQFDPVARSFILVCAAVAYAAWDVGFELGAFGRIFFEKLFMVWSISTALFIALLVMPKNRVRIPRLALLTTAFPSIWLVLALSARASPETHELRYLLFSAGLVSYLACFPYAIYMAVSLAYPDLMRTEKLRPKITVLAIIVVLFAAGYIMGTHHNRLMTCEDFEVSGQYVPEDCQPGTGHLGLP